ncbi:MAG: hypothetical protein P8P74_01425 [Crocinitomicaceae bacterium]|nr:hypothetical protein [Crocinitomicaceae bacterium]
MRKAIIDMGTNTFNLLVADVDERSFKSIYSTKEPVLLGMGGINDNRIADDAMARAMLALQKFTKTCDAFEIDRENIRAFGTSALRGAENACAFTAKVKDVFDVDVSIISGQEEANFIYQGVKLNHDFASPAVIMDIGGGSSEFIHANANGIMQMHSLDIGVSRVYQQFDFPETYSTELQNAIFSYFDQCEDKAMDCIEAETLIGASGSFETFYEMIFEKKWEVNREVTELPMSELRRILNWSVQSNQTERNKHVWITQIRKTMLPIAALQVLWALNRIKASRVILSPYSLKEGVLYE